MVDVDLRSYLQKGVEIIKGVVPANDFDSVRIRIKNVSLNFNYTEKTLASYDYDENRIVFSRKFLEVATNKQITNVMIHELLHLVYPDDGHKGKWKQMANLFNRSHYANEYGKIERLVAIKIPKKTAQYKYVLTCEKCGFVAFKKRSTCNFYANHQTNYSHRGCGGKFTWGLNINYPGNKKAV